MDRISNAVPASRPLSKTAREIASGFSSTAEYVCDEPMALTIPSPTRAMTVSSVAPPTRPGIFVRTVTRALAFTSMPSFATAASVPLTGASITFGYTEVATASFTSRPARSIAVAVSNGS